MTGEDSTNLDVFHLVSGATEANRQLVLAQSQLGTPVVDQLTERHGQTNLLSLGDDRGGLELPVDRALVPSQLPACVVRRSSSAVLRL
ncbi:hypothetical protein AB0A71_42845 [Kitasatospora aureofaciens]|uniref:hypothetical protein n=1 Tax=Kitasatospora aureofaciens TaxID=1894 RepID=UPI00340488D6